jgi:hypothetical protein
VPGGRAKMAQMFQAAAIKARPAKPVDDASADALLDDILGNLGPGRCEPGKQRKNPVLGLIEWDTDWKFTLLLCCRAMLQARNCGGSPSEACFAAACGALLAQHT